MTYCGGLTPTSCRIRSKLVTSSEDHSRNVTTPPHLNQAQQTGFCESGFSATLPVQLKMIKGALLRDYFWVCYADVVPVRLPTCLPSMRILFALLLALSFSSCTSTTESTGVDAVLSFYGGKALYSSGMVTSTEDKLQGRFYELMLSGVAPKMKQYFTSLQLPASNCAYLFYHALSPEEKMRYSFIRITIEETASNNTYEFPTHDLAKVERAMRQADTLLKYMRTGDYARFVAKGSLFATSAQEWQKAKSLFTAIDEEYGRVQSFSLQGFEISHQNLAKRGTTEFIRLAGVLVRGKQNTDFTFALLPNTTPQDPYLYGFVFSKRESQ
jgi:hypothetical protein